MPLAFELVTADRVVLQDDAVDAVIAPGTDGELGILPHHVPLITTLATGELRVRKGREETSIALYRRLHGSHRHESPHPRGRRRAFGRD